MGVVSRTDHDRWQLSIRRTSDDGTPLGGIRWDALAIDRNDSLVPIEVREAGLGRYEATVPTVGVTDLAIRLRDVNHDRMSVQHYHRPYPAEYRLAQAPQDAFTTIPTLDGESAVAGLRPQCARRSVAEYAYAGALICLLLSVFLRRL